MQIKPNKWPKEVWLVIFILLAALYFLTINQLPGKITGGLFASANPICEWDYLTDEFETKEVLSLELEKYFYTREPLVFSAYSADGDIFLEKELLVFFPNKKFSTLTIVAKGENAACSKTLRIIS